MGARRLIDRHRVPAMVLAAATCLVAVPASPRADDGSGPPQGFWNKVLEKLDLKTRPGAMPDFVQATHPDPARLTFIPTGPAPRNQTIPVKSSEEIESMKASLDAAQAAQLRPGAAPAHASPPRRKAKPAKAAAATTKPMPQAD